MRRGVPIELNYNGFDDESMYPFYKERLEFMEGLLRNEYIRQIKLFQTESLDNPEPYRFLKPENTSILLIIYPNEYVDNVFPAEAIFLSTPKQRTVEVRLATSEDLQGHFETDKEGVTINILHNLDYEPSQIIINKPVFYNKYSPESSLLSESYKKEFWKEVFEGSSLPIVKSVIRAEVKNFKKNNETKLSYYAKDAHKFPFSLIDLDPLIELVDNEDFTYQLDQAMAAYHQNLFLPSAATLGVVLETLCILILEQNDVRVKNQDTQLGTLRDKIAGEKIMARRDNTRLEVAYKMRNMAAHSNPGSALKEDCHFMLNVINTLAFEYLKREV